MYNSKFVGRYGRDVTYAYLMPLALSINTYLYAMPTWNRLSFRRTWHVMCINKTSFSFAAGDRSRQVLEIGEYRCQIGKLCTAV